jgi:hypothetical protein
LADYGSTVESEIEMFALIARANDDPRGFSLLAMVVSLFETGYLPKAASGFFRDDRGHVSRDAERMGVRPAGAMARGKQLAVNRSTLEVVRWTPTCSAWTGLLTPIGNSWRFALTSGSPRKPRESSNPAR